MRRLRPDATPEHVMADLDEHYTRDEIAALLADVGVDEEALVRSIASAAADDDPDAQRWGLTRSPDSIDRLLDKANASRDGTT